MALYRFDLTFSYWIFAWYFLYMTGIVKQSAALALFMGLITNVVSLLIFIVQRVDPKMIFIFFVLLVIMKVFPLWTLRTEIKHMDVNWKTQLKNTLLLYLLYTMWLFLNQTNQLELGKHMMYDFKSGELSRKWSPGTSLVVNFLRMNKL